MDNVKDSIGGEYRPAALHIGCDGAAEDGCGRKGSLANLQTRHRSVLQSGATRPGSGQGLHEGARPRTLRALQGGALPGLAEAVSVGKARCWTNVSLLGRHWRASPSSWRWSERGAAPTPEDEWWARWRSPGSCSSWSSA